MINLADCASLQDAVNALPSTGGTILIPTGTFSIPANVTITKPNVELLGYALNASILQASTADPNYSLITAKATNFAIRNITIDGRATGASPPAVDVLQVGPGISPMFWVSIVNCELRNAGRNALRIRGNVYNLVAFNSVFRVCRDSALDVAEEPVNTPPTHLHFQACSFDRNYQVAVRLLTPTGSGPDNITFEQCRFEGNRATTPANALHAESVVALRLEKCHFELDGTGGADTPAGRVEKYMQIVTCPGAVIQDCTFNGSTNTAVQPTRVAYVGTSALSLSLNNRYMNINTTQALQFDAGSAGCISVGGTSAPNDLRDALQGPGCTRISQAGLRIPFFADDTARNNTVTSSPDLREKGALIWVDAPTSPAFKLQIWDGTAWKGVTLV